MVNLGLACALIAAALPRAAHAEPTDTSRVVHGSALVGGGVTYLVVELGLKKYLVPDHCRLCDPPGIDVAVRDALIWDNTRAANITSTVTGYAMAPMLATGLLVASTWSDGNGRRWADDTIPVLEAAISTGLLHHVTKFTLGRQRPFVHYADPSRAADLDDNASLFSGHTALAFAVATSAGVVAHQRHYAVEPYVWAGGAVLAVTTGYLRIAADKHWFTDVLIGAGVGIGVGLLIPLTLHGDSIEARPVQRQLLSFGGTF